MAGSDTTEILKKFESLPEEIQGHFEHFRALLAKDLPLDVLITYLFSRVEAAQHMTIYCGVVKRHKVDASLAWKATLAHRMTRSDFREFYATIFAKGLSHETADKIRKAQTTRDQIVHDKGRLYGRTVSGSDKTQAVVDVLDYAVALDDEVSEVARFRPFRPLRGFKGRAKSLDKATSFLILQGIGLFPPKKKKKQAQPGGAQIQ